MLSGTQIFVVRELHDDNMCRLQQILITCKIQCEDDKLITTCTLFNQNFGSNVALILHISITLCLDSLGVCSLPSSSQCPYHHSVEARSNASDCPNWLDGRCTSIHCPLRHPGAREANKSSGQLKHPGCTVVFWC